MVVYHSSSSLPSTFLFAKFFPYKYANDKLMRNEIVEDMIELFKYDIQLLLVASTFKNSHKIIFKIVAFQFS